MFVVSTRNFPPDIGGIQNLIEGLSNSLLNHGPVKVFADSHEDSLNYDQHSKLQIQRVKGFKFLKKYRKVNLIKEFLEKNKVRAIFFDHWKSIENINKDNLLNTKSFCLIHSKEINHPQNTSINKRMIKSLNKADYVISNSNFTKQLAIQNGVNQKKIEIIHPGCDYPIETNRDSKTIAYNLYKDCFPRIITIARLDKRKSHQNILMTIKNLLPKFPKLKYISVGDGDEINNLENLKKQLGLDKEVSFIRKSDEQLKVALLDQSDLFLMPSIVHKKSIEGFGISFIEAACFAKPSIGGISGGEADAIIHGKTGYLCNGDDLNSIYETIIKCFNNNSYKELGMNALNFSENFKWSKIIKKYLLLI